MILARRPRRSSTCVTGSETPTETPTNRTDPLPAQGCPVRREPSSSSGAPVPTTDQRTTTIKRQRHPRGLIPPITRTSGLRAARSPSADADASQCPPEAGTYGWGGFFRISFPWGPTRGSQAGVPLLSAVVGGLASALYPRVCARRAYAILRAGVSLLRLWVSRVDRVVPVVRGSSVGSGPGVVLPKRRCSGFEAGHAGLMSRPRLPSRARIVRAASARSWR